MAPNVQQVASSLLPSFSANVILYGIISLVVIAVIGFGFYWMFKRMKYNMTFVIFQDSDGKPKVVDRCKGMLITLGKTGEKVFHIPKYQKYLPLGNLQMGARTFYYYIDKAGHWHNFDITHIDVKKREPQLNMQLQMDYARDGINKRLEDRHVKEGFWQKWGTIVVSIVVITVLLVFIWLAFRDALANNTESQKNLQVSQKLQTDLNSKYTNLLIAMDRVCTGQHVDLSLINQTGQ